MNGPYRWGIRRKFFCIMLIILILYWVVLLIMGSTLFRSFYMYNKVSELEDSARQIRNVYRKNKEMLSDAVEAVENRNILVALLSQNEENQEIELQYFTRYRDYEKFQNERRQKYDDFQNEENSDNVSVPNFTPSENNEPFALEPPPEEPGSHFPFPLFDHSLIQQIPNVDEELIVHGKEELWKGHLSLLTRLDENLYLYIETPKNYIQSTADLAVRYTSYLSLVIFFIGAIGIYFLAHRVTRPIVNIQKVADRISKMDFSQKCVTYTKDELGSLSLSINNMSLKLQSNINQLIKANEILKSDLERQQKIDHMRRQFVANVSHDFKTPLTLIISYAEAIQQTVSDPEQKANCSIIIEEGNNLSRMVGSLLELSQLESGVRSIEPTIFCLNELLDSIIHSHRILTEKSGIEVQRCYTDEYIVEADYHKMKQVVTNILENAIKYGNKPGLIKICTVQDGEKCKVSIFNQGTPLADEVIENIFVSFYREDSSRHRSTQSYGLGLAIVKAIMDMHHESYGCENVPNGINFWFTLPIINLDEES